MIRSLPDKHTEPRKLLLQYSVVYVGYLKEVHRSDDYVVVCHVPELTEADLPTLSLRRE